MTRISFDEDGNTIIPVHFDGAIKRTLPTKKHSGAALCLFGSRKVWLPLSQIELIDIYELDMPRWLFDAKNIDESYLGEAVAKEHKTYYNLKKGGDTDGG